jgi:cellulose synthase (UDP-forming)
MRWASGGFEILMQRNPLSPRTRLTLDQRLQYTVTATHYFAGITPFLLLMVPPLEIFFDLRPVDLTVTPFTWFLFYAGFYGLQMLLAFHTMGSFRIETLVLATVSFPIYMSALVNVFSGKEQKWHVTGRGGRRSSPFNFMIPQVLTFFFLFLTSLVAIGKDTEHQTLTLATAWNVTNTVVIGVFIVAAFRESHRARAAQRRPVAVAPALPASFATASSPMTRRARRLADVRAGRSRPTPTPELISLNERRTS